MSRVYVDYLQDMLDNSQRAIQFVQGMTFESFKQDDKTVYAVIRAVEIIGEAASKIPEDLRGKYVELPWRDIKSMRNKLVHNYFGINMEVVWQTVRDDLPLIVAVLEDILKKENNK